MSGNNLTRATARNLRELALSVPEGQFLGTEKDLLVKFGISRPTFRQAVHIIESERVVAKVRGLNGGLFSRRPDLEGVVASAATYLRSRDTTLGDVLGAADSAVADTVSLAAMCEDAALRARLGALIEDLAASENEVQPVCDFREDELRYIHLVCEMCGNPALDLMVRVFYQVGSAAFDTIFEGREALMQNRRTSRLQLLRAIFNGDAKAAVDQTRRGGDHARVEIAPMLLGLPVVSIPSRDVEG
jgi:DNA-binding FadR family transcriptional regulator